MRVRIRERESARAHANRCSILADSTDALTYLVFVFALIDASKHFLCLYVLLV